MLAVLEVAVHPGGTHLGTVHSGNVPRELPYVEGDLAAGADSIALLVAPSSAQRRA